MNIRGTIHGQAISKYVQGLQSGYLAWGMPLGYV